ncbi:MAG TPA: inositol monophosphatase family protein [Devosiaceae bacterium]|nr:inositol monophosphatase family protein [Devosiaceae bacterium]
MSGVDVEALAGILREAARAEILPRWRRLDPETVRVKSNPADLVTEADEGAERVIHARVAALMPEAAFVGEESVAADPKLIEAVTAADLAVVVDPVDGTGNFAAGLPMFAVMMAVVARGECIAGLIFDALADDCVVAERGAGTRLLRADSSSVPLRVAEPVPLEEMVGAASVGFLPRDVRRAVYPNLAKVRHASAYRCAGQEYRAMAAGHLHFLFYSKLLPWDHLPGALIVSEAGGFVARTDGSRYRPQDTSGSLLLASDRDSWDLLRREIFAV